MLSKRDKKYPYKASGLFKASREPAEAKQQNKRMRTAEITKIGKYHKEIEVYFDSSVQILTP